MYIHVEVCVSLDIVDRTRKISRVKVFCWPVVCGYSQEILRWDLGFQEIW